MQERRDEPQSDSLKLARRLFNRLLSQNPVGRDLVRKARNKAPNFNLVHPDGIFVLTRRRKAAKVILDTEHPHPCYQELLKFAGCEDDIPVLDIWCSPDEASLKRAARRIIEFWSADPATSISSEPGVRRS